MVSEKLIRYKNDIASSLGGDNLAADMLVFEAGRTECISTLGKQPFLFHGILSIISNVLYPIFGLKRFTDIKDEDFVFVSCPDPIFRTKTIGLIAGGLKYTVLYLPNFHIFSALRYHKFFKEKGINAFFPTIRLKYVLKARKRLKDFKKHLDLHDSNVETKKLISVMSRYLIYDEVVKASMDHAVSFKGKWILEHEKFYFMPFVVNIHQRGEQCTMLQHGCFMEIDVDFMPLFSDKVLCCSERERKIYISNGLEPSNVITFGAPLQTLGTKDSFDVKYRKKHSLLILLTIANEESIEPMRAVLSFVKDNYQDVLIRMRPRSKNNDMKLLEKELRNLEISNNKSSLAEDIVCCDKVISFSEDANIEVTKHNKPFIYVHPWLGENRELRRDMPYATMDNYKDEIKKLMENEFYSSFSKEQYKEIVGETDVNILRQRFENYIRKD